MAGKTAKASTPAAPASPTERVAAVASSEVGYFEAEEAPVPPAKENKKVRKLVQFKNFSMKGTLDLPEQATWHDERKRAILKAHPEIEKLFGYNPWTALLFVYSFTACTGLAIYMGTNFFGNWPVFLGTAYTIGAIFSWQCMTVSHEGAHRLISPIGWVNQLIACLSFLPVITGPFGNYWAIEHMYHHRVVVDKMNRYGPQQSGPLRKAIGALLFFAVVNTLFSVISFIVYVRTLVQLVLFTIGLAKTPYPREKLPAPYCNFPQAVNGLFVFNTTAGLVYNGLLYYYFGAGPLVFLFVASAFANGLHPLGMRQVQEHYLQVKGQPTYSVYSPISTILFNLGYHVEHHDFPRIPWNRLPQVRKLAPEFYNNIFYYNSYSEVLYKFLFTPGIPIGTLLEEYDDVVHSSLKKFM